MVLSNLITGKRPMFRQPTRHLFRLSAIRLQSMALSLLLLILLGSGCARPTRTRVIESASYKVMETTAYCGCSICCSWERGSWQWLKLDFWNRYVKSGPSRGSSYSGLTASGTVPYEPEEGFFSMDSLERPWMIPLRLILFPWYFMPQEGTIAADTKYYPFGTRMYIPNYGWGRVEDRGRNIKGPTRIDLFFDSHDDALEWGRKKIRVYIERSRGPAPPGVRKDS